MATVPLTHLRTAIDASPGGVLLVDANGAIVIANEKLEQLFGYSPGELSGSPVDVLVPDGARPYHGELRSAFFEQPSTRRMGTGRDLFGVSKDGTKIPVEIGLNPVETEAGMLVMCTVLDITERRRQDDRFRTALDAAPNAILMVGDGGTIVLCNSATERVFGHTREELIGRPVETLVPRRMHRRHAVYRTGYLSAPAPRAMGADKELMGVHATGREFPVEVGLQPVTMPDGDYVIASVVDISERRAAQAEIERKNVALSSRNEEIRIFAYSTSHDLKGPLLTIEGLGKCLEEDVATGRYEDVAENAARIRKLAGRLAAVVDGVLSLAESEQIGLRRTAVGVRELVESVVDSLDSIRKENDVEVVVDVPEDCVFSTERPRLDAIIRNLVSNSIKYCSPDELRRNVTIRAHRDSENCVLTVSDNGQGIPPDMLERVFRVFQRGHASPGGTGAGLGLALVQRHVERLGGTIELTSDRGTVVSLTFPTEGAQAT